MTVNITRLQHLGYNFSLRLRGSAQFTKTRLLASEQFGIGGWNSVRGYDEQEASGDQGYFYSIDLLTPVVSLGSGLGFAKAADTLQFLTFWDNAVAEVHDGKDGTVSAPGPIFRMMSFGVGTRYKISDYFTARFDYGWQMEDTDVSAVLRHDYNSRGHFSITLSY